MAQGRFDSRRDRIRSRIWREWCFVRVVIRNYRVHILLMAITLTLGAYAFLRFEPGIHTTEEAVFFTWSLIFGETPEEFPDSPILQAMFFLLPVFGLGVIVEAIVDFAFIIRDRRRHERNWCAMMSSYYKDHIIIVGMGRLGYKTFKMLRRLGQDVVVIERGADNQFLEDVRREGSPIFIGDARREAFLDDARVEQARSIILATTDDLANLEIALDARRKAPGVRVVLRMFDQNMADKIRDGFDIRLAMSQSAISAPAFATAAIESSIVSSIMVDDQLIIMQRWTVRKNGPFDGLTVGDLLVGHRFSVVELTSEAGEKQLFPPPITALEIGDRLLVQGPFDALSEVTRGAVS